MKLKQFASKITRRKIQVVLGILWLIDGLLQFQPQMFTANFMNDVIRPAAVGQPSYVASPIHFAISVFMTHPAFFDVLIALTQLAIGILILNKKTVKLGLAGSIVWGLFVWYFGEAIGGLGSGHTLLLMGAPGAALLYSLISIGVWPQKDKDHRPASWLAIVWAAIWLGGAVLQMIGGQNTTKDLSTMISGMASGAPGWLGSLDLHTANLISRQENWLIVILIIVQTLIGILIFTKSRARTITIGAGIIMSLIFWTLGQSFGTIYSGVATDLNSAPLIILLGIAILGSKEIDLNLT